MCPSHPQPAQSCTRHCAQRGSSIHFIYPQLSCCPAPSLFAMSRCSLRAQSGRDRGCHTAQERRSRHWALFCSLVEPEGGHWVWAALPWEPGAGITATPPNQNRSRAELCTNCQGVAGFVLGRGGVQDWAWKEPTVRMRRGFRAWTRRAFAHQKTCTFLERETCRFSLSPVRQSFTCSLQIVWNCGKHATRVWYLDYKGHWNPKKFYESRVFAQPSLYPAATTITKSTLQEGFSYKSVSVGEESKSGSHA